MTNEGTNERIDEWVEKISRTLDEQIASRPLARHAPLFEAARYSLLSNGKRLRPLISLAIADAWGVAIEKALYPACALEIVHTYSLIHDDLPCMDDDDMRRGQPSLHKVFGDGHAVLTGDFLLTYSFELLAKSPDLSPTQILELIHILASHAGADGMIGGQSVDLAYAAKPLDAPLLHFIHLHKTASLIIAAFLFGGIIGGASSQDLAILKESGTQFGLGFQIADDIFDAKLESSPSSAVSVLGAEQARLYADQLFTSARASLKNLSRPTPQLQFLINLFQ